MDTTKPYSHQALVVELALTPHPNADNLSVMAIDGNTVVLNTAEWQGRTKAVHVLPESIVDLSRPEFSWLDKPLVKPVKLRGVISWGLLVPVEDEAVVGEDYSDRLGIKHFQPNEEFDEVVKFKGGSKEAEGGPPIYAPKYDLESLAKFHTDHFLPGEPVYICEKLEGQSVRVLYSSRDNRYYVGSRNEWKDPKKENLIWKAFEYNRNLKDACYSNPDVVFYGELVGNVKGFRYGCEPGQPRIIIFDVLKAGEWIDYGDAIYLAGMYGFEFAPFLAYDFPFDYEKIRDMSDAMTNTMVENADHIAEGLVIRGQTEKNTPGCGRNVLKIKSYIYLHRK